MKNNKDYIINSFDEITYNTLIELEKTQHDFWNISRATAEFLYIQIIAKNAKNVIEVGTSNGYSGIWLSKALKKTGGKLTTIEYYSKRQDLAIDNFKKCGTLDIITTLLGDACENLRNLPPETKFDFAFIDANKRESIEYFNLINPHLISGGVFACDNVNSHREKVQTFLDAIDNHPQYQNIILDLPAGLSFAIKTC